MISALCTSASSKKGLGTDLNESTLLYLAWEHWMTMRCVALGTYLWQEARMVAGNLIIHREAVTEEELDGYRMWQEAVGGAWE